MKKARVLQLISNFYTDKGNQGEHTLRLGEFEYCCFGYFDALYIRKVEEHNANQENVLAEMMVRNLNGECSRRNLVCFVEDETKEEEFWKNNEDAMLFISLIRINREQDGKLVKTKKAVRKINEEREDAIAYFSSDHTEVVVLKKGKGYGAGAGHILELHNQFSILKIYSIFAIREEVLEGEEKIKNSVEGERVDCRLRASIKLTESGMGGMDERNEKVRKFVGLLLKELTDSEGKEPAARIYNSVLGSTDVLIEINRVPIQRLLACYKMNHLLTHTNPEYEGLFYNIETELLTEGDFIGNEVD